MNAGHLVRNCTLNARLVQACSFNLTELSTGVVKKKWHDLGILLLTSKVHHNPGHPRRMLDSISARDALKYLGQA
jgi:hypothetical protein